MEHASALLTRSDAAWATPRAACGGRGFLVIDDFYEDPDTVRELALGQYYETDPALYTGRRSSARFLSESMMVRFRTWLGARSLGVEYHHSGSFQCAEASHKVCVHADPCTFAGVVYLSPDAPSSAGTSFFRHRATGATHGPTADDAARRNVPLEALRAELFRSNIYDADDAKIDEVWDRVDRVGNVYNRLVLWDGMRLHAASGYFGDSLETGRLVQVFFFNAG